MISLHQLLGAYAGAFAGSQLKSQVFCGEPPTHTRGEGCQNRKEAAKRVVQIEVNDGRSLLKEIAQRCEKVMQRRWPVRLDEVHRDFQLLKEFSQRPCGRSVAENDSRLVALAVNLRNQELEVFLGTAKKDGIGKVDGLLRLIHPGSFNVK